MDESAVFNIAALINVSDKGIRGPHGELLPRELGWGITQYDIHTVYGKYPASVPLQMLRRALVVVEQSELEDPVKDAIIEVCHTSIEQLETKYNPRWYDILCAGLSTSNQVVFDDIMMEVARDV